MEKEHYFGIYRGVVEDINDPLNLGRCRIRVPSIHGNLNSTEFSLLPWARYVSPLPTGNNKGMFILPEVKDVVWVFFEGGDKKFPVYIGSTYGIVNGINEVPLDNENPLELELLFRSKKNPNGDRATIRKNNEFLEFNYGESSIKINSDGTLSIHSTKELDITSDTSINLSAPIINLNK